MQSERSLIPTPMPVRRHARSGNRGLVLTALCLAVLLVVMDNTIVNVAIPTMSDALNASSTDLQWVVDAYTLSFAALLLPAGKLSDRWGRRRMLLVGLAGFAVVSAATAFSWALWQLVTLRVVLGVCAALIYPATLSSIIVIFEGSRYRSLAVGLWAATSGVGIAWALSSAASCWSTMRGIPFSGCAPSSAWWRWPASRWRCPRYGRTVPRGSISPAPCYRWPAWACWCGGSSNARLTAGSPGRS